MKGVCYLWNKSWTEELTALLYAGTVNMTWKQKLELALEGHGIILYIYIHTYTHICENIKYK